MVDACGVNGGDEIGSSNGISDGNSDVNIKVSPLVESLGAGGGAARLYFPFLKFLSSQTKINMNYRN